MTMTTKEERVKEDIDQNDILQKVYHTDARVTAMEGEIRSISGGLVRIENMLLNKPEPNVLGWLGAGFTFVGFVAALLFGVASYVDLTLSPIRGDVKARAEVVAEHHEFRREQAYDQGRTDEWRRQYEERVEHNHDRLHDIEDDISRIDSEGSRVWQRKQPQ